mmetsp:Transcript_11725/g.23275  ORF Transcript_11725/g.23275 Transcript_11725/m.23275 type:complete len:432 (+) Transcript_11725:66-1361(+)
MIKFFSSKVVLTGNGKVIGMALIGVGGFSVGNFLNEHIDFGKFSSLLKNSLLGKLNDSSNTSASRGGGASTIDNKLLRAVDDKLERMAQRVESLGNSRSVTTVVERPAASSSSGGVSVVVVASGLAVSGVLYVTLWRGNYLTKAHLSAAVRTMSEGITSVSKSVEQLRGQVVDHFTTLTGKVDESMGVQEELKDSVEAMQGDLQAVREVVLGCEQFLMESARKQDVTMRGVQLLCGVVAEGLASGSARNQLEQFVSGSAHLLSPPASSVPAIASATNRRRRDRRERSGGSGSASSRFVRSCKEKAAVVAARGSLPAVTVAGGDSSESSSRVNPPREPALKRASFSGRGGGGGGAGGGWGRGESRPCDSQLEPSLTRPAPSRLFGPSHSSLERDVGSDSDAGDYEDDGELTAGTSESSSSFNEMVPPPFANR